MWTLLFPFQSCRHRSCVKSGYFRSLGPSGSDKEYSRDAWEGHGCEWERRSSKAQSFHSSSLRARKIITLPPLESQGNGWEASLLSAFFCNFCREHFQSFHWKINLFLETHVQAAEYFPDHQHPSSSSETPNLHVQSLVPIVSSDKRGPSEQLKLSINNL